MVPKEAITMTMEETKPVKKPSHKKKTTKLMVQEIPLQENETIGNIILHLNCSMEDLENEKKKQFKDPLQYNPEIPLDIQTFDPNSSFSTNIYTHESVLSPNMAYQSFCQKCNESRTQVEPVCQEKDNQMVQQKVRQLKISYFMNQVDENKASSCFWCTCEFLHSAFFLPQSENKEHIVVYGCFCSPECAVGFLFQEHLDDSMKFERYHLLQKLYRSVSGNIRPAPSPHYLLDKFLGTLSIQEYRQLLKNQQHQYIIMVNKPMTRVLPEIHNEGDVTANISAYKIRRA